MKYIFKLSLIILISLIIMYKKEENWLLTQRKIYAGRRKIVSALRDSNKVDI